MEFALARAKVDGENEATHLKTPSSLKHSYQYAQRKRIEGSLGCLISIWVVMGVEDVGA